MTISYYWPLLIIPFIQMLGVYVIGCIGLMKSKDEQQYFRHLKDLFKPPSTLAISILGFALFIWGASLYFFVFSVLYVEKYVGLIDQRSSLINTATGVLRKSNEDDRVYFVEGVPFRFGRGVSPIRCINSDLHRRYRDNLVTVWYIKDKSNRFQFRDVEIPVNCMLRISFLGQGHAPES